jgi:two-component system OmpR family response regulator
MRVLLLEDDAMIAEALRTGLKDAAYAVDWVGDAAAADAALACNDYQALLLDLGLPDRDGLQVLQRLRQRGLALPVLIISARDALRDRIQGLDLGADDFIVKPFALDELLARLRAVMRRRGGHATAVLSNGTLSLDPATKLASHGDAPPQLLSGREFALLQALLLRPGAILGRAELEDRIYGWGEEVESNIVDVLIHGIRKKLGPDAIRNVRGAGWMVAPGR